MTTTANFEQLKDQLEGDLFIDNVQLVLYLTDASQYWICNKKMDGELSVMLQFQITIKHFKFSLNLYLCQKYKQIVT